MLNWTPWAVPGLLVFFGGLALAWFVYRSRPDRWQNRVLALQLICEAIAIGFLGGAPWIIADAGTARLLGLVAMFVIWPKLWTYYSFLATLDTPLARPLNRPGVLSGLLAFTLLAGLTVVFRPDWYGGEAVWWPAVRGYDMTAGTAFIPVLWLWVAMWIVGLAFSVSAVRHARSDIHRDQARAYLAAFGFRDVGFALSAVLFTFVPHDLPYFHWLFMLFPTVWLVYYPLVTWGILKHQLFDIELRLKRGVERSVIAAAIAGVFFVLSYALEQFVSANNFVLGLAMAAAIALVFRPLQRTAERFADRLMPGVDTSEAYLEERRHEVYRNAVEAALQDGSVSDRERAILDRLRESLGVDAGEAATIERVAARTFRSADGLIPGTA